MSEDNKSLALKKAVVEAILEEKQKERNALVQTQESEMSYANSDDQDDTNRTRGKTDQVMNRVDLRSGALGELNMQVRNLEDLDFSERHSAVEEGSLVLTDHQNMLICVAHTHITIDGKDIYGISHDAPIYHAMKGKKPGDHFNWHGEDYMIREVY